MEAVKMSDEFISFTMDNLMNDQAKKGIKKLGECSGYTQKNLVKISKVLNSIFVVATKEEQEFFKKRDALIAKDIDGKPVIDEKNDYVFTDAELAKKEYQEFLTKTHSIPYKKIDLYDVMPAGVSPHDVICLSFLIQD
jgi:hypothetical protein